MKTSKEYKAIKNFVHNELGLTKEEFLKIFTEATKDEAKAFVQRKFQQQEGEFIKIAEESVKIEVYNRITGRTFDSSRDSLFQGIGKEIAKSLKFEQPV